jgi:hypothetical protein
MPITSTFSYLCAEAPGSDHEDANLALLQDEKNKAKTAIIDSAL